MTVKRLANNKNHPPGLQLWMGGGKKVGGEGGGGKESFRNQVDFVQYNLQREIQQLRKLEKCF